MQVLILCHGQAHDNACTTSGLEEEEILMATTLDVDPSARPTFVYDLLSDVDTDALPSRHFDLITTMCCPDWVWVTESGDIEDGTFIKCARWLKKDGVLAFVLNPRGIIDLLRKTRSVTKHVFQIFEECMAYIDGDTDTCADFSVIRRLFPSVKDAVRADIMKNPMIRTLFRQLPDVLSIPNLDPPPQLMFSVSIFLEKKN